MNTTPSPPLRTAPNAVIQLGPNIFADASGLDVRVVNQLHDKRYEVYLKPQQVQALADWARTLWPPSLTNKLASQGIATEKALERLKRLEEFAEKMRLACVYASKAGSGDVAASIIERELITALVPEVENDT